MVALSSGDGIHPGNAEAEDEGESGSGSQVSPSRQFDIGQQSEVMPGKRGLTMKETLGATLTRFLPTSLLSVGAVVALFEPGIHLSEFLIPVLVFTGLITLGFGVGLEGLRRWLYPEADVSGRRSVLAGLLSPLAWLAAFLIVEPLGAIVGLAEFFFVGLVGVVLALGMFFPWLTPTMEADDVGEEAFLDREGTGILSNGGSGREP